MDHLFDVLPEKANGISSEKEFWDILTIGQKAFYTYLNFEGEIDNGGILQFFWNKPEFAYAAMELIELLEIPRLWEDYLLELNKFIKVRKNLNALRESIRYTEIGWQDRSNKAYEESRMILGINSQIKSYFYQKTFKLELHKKICSYIESNRELFIYVDQTRNAS